MDEVGEAEAHAAPEGGPHAQALDEDRGHPEPDEREPGAGRTNRVTRNAERQEDGRADGEREHEAAGVARNVEHERAGGDVRAVTTRPPPSTATTKPQGRSNCATTRSSVATGTPTSSAESRNRRP